jgi:hypothetical protein
MLNLLFRSFRFRKNTLKAISPIAMMKAATAATDKPAICAGVILGLSSSTAGSATGVEVDDAEEVADGVEDTESGKMDWVEIRVCSVVLVMDVMDVTDEVTFDSAEDLDDVGVGELLVTMVRAVFVGRTAFFCPRHTLYAEAALRSTVRHDV